MPESVRSDLVTHTVKQLDLPQIRTVLKKELGLPLAALFVDAYIDLFRSRGEKPLVADVCPADGGCLHSGGYHSSATGIVVDDMVMTDVAGAKITRTARGLLKSVNDTAKSAFPQSSLHRRNALPETTEGLDEARAMINTAHLLK